MRSAGAASLVPEKACWRSTDVIAATGLFARSEGNRSVGVNLVLLRLRFRLVLLVDVLNRAFPLKFAWQYHHANKAARFVGRRLREHGVRSGFIPRTARTKRGRAPVRVDPNAALDQAADAGALMAMQVSAAAGRKGDAVAAHQQIAFRQRLQKSGQLLVSDHAGRVGCCAALIAAREFPAPACDSGCAGLDLDCRITLPRFALAHCLLADSRGT